MKQLFTILFFLPAFAYAQTKPLNEVVKTITTSFKNDVEVLKPYILPNVVNSKFNSVTNANELSLKIDGAVESFIDTKDPRITTCYWYFGEAPNDKGVLKSKYQALKKELDATMKQNSDYKYENEYAQENYTYYYSQYGSVTLELTESSKSGKSMYILSFTAEKSKKTRAK